MRTRTLVVGLALSLFIALGSISGPRAAWAVPSFARQTALPCEQCHTSFPELTKFGRQFKLDGYTLTATATVGSEGDRLALNATPPLSFMLQAGYTRTSKAVPDSAVPGNAQNGTLLLPQELSLFYAGRISPQIGAFTQITYSGQDDHFSIDNTDIRFAQTTSIGDNSLVYGVTLNNSPTVQDLWNTTPTWGFPFAATEVAPAPGVATLVEDGLGQQVVGLGGYFGYNGAGGLIYGEYTLYIASQIGNSQLPIDSAAESPVKGTAPYLRLAYERDLGNGSLEVGLLSLRAGLIPGTGNPIDSDPDKYTDTGLDVQYQLQSGGDDFGVKFINIKEKRSWSSLSSTSNTSDTLTSRRITGTYVHQHAYSVNLQLFQTKGSADALAYPVNANGSPDSAGEVLELAYTPWLNTRFSLQYTVYSKFDGASSDYDGAGRNAKDNNTIYLLAWFMF
jgi:hypothetical protein